MIFIGYYNLKTRDKKEMRKHLSTACCVPAGMRQSEKYEALQPYTLLDRLNKNLFTKSADRASPLFGQLVE